jgi:small subunit ribosomal protein S1
MDQEQRFAALLEDDYDYKRPRRGQLRQAIVLSIGENEVIVDLGCKRDGIVPRTDLEMLDNAYRANLRAGDRVPVCVLATSGRQDDLIVSMEQGLAQQDWLRAQEYLESGEVCEAEVTDVNRGGVLVPFGRLRGFVPNSQLLSVPRGLRGDRLYQVKSDLVGQALSLAVIEVDQRRRRLVLSERVADCHRRQQLLDELTEGETRTGVVSNLVKFGAFVDLGGVDGLIHISELAWGHVDHPSQVLSVGDKVQVYVLRVDREQERIGLSRRRLIPDPWTLVTERLNIDQTVEGIVTKIAEFGVFVDIGEGIEGLVHVSEVPGGKDACMKLEPQSQISVRVLKIDPWQRRIGLSLRGVEPVAPASRVEEVAPS